MNRKEIKEKLAEHCSALKFHRDGTFTVVESYFYRMGRTPSDLAEMVQDLLPKAILVDKGDHFHAFVGGSKAGSATDSFFWAKFRTKKVDE